MSYTYHGVELVNCSPPRRKGPYTHFPQGQYKGERIEDVIRRNPKYVMWAVKEWLNLTPSQAGLFETVTGGGIIPDRFIVQKVPSPKPESPLKEDSPQWTGEDCTWPNLGFDPDLAPGWWQEFEEKAKSLSGAQAKWLFEDYRRKELKELQKLWKIR